MRVGDERVLEAPKNSSRNSPNLASKTSRLAITSLGLGILSVPYFFRIWAGFPAIILGIIALVKISRSSAKLKGKGLAVAGMAIAIAMLLLLVFEIIIASF